MAENRKKNPISLNQRHSSFVKDISSSKHHHEKPPMVKVEGRRRLYKLFCKDLSSDDDNIQPFSELEDFHSPIKEDNAGVEKTLGYQTPPRKGSLSPKNGDSGPNFSVFSASDSPKVARKENEKNIDGGNDAGGCEKAEDQTPHRKGSPSTQNRDSGPNFSVFSSSDSPMVAGKENENYSCGDDNAVDVKKPKDQTTPRKGSPRWIDKWDSGPKFSVISSSDSSMAARKETEKHTDGADEIREILSQLSSKLDSLSINKRKIRRNYGETESLNSRLFSEEKSGADVFSKNVSTSQSVFDVDNNIYLIRKDETQEKYYDLNIREEQNEKATISRCEKIDNKIRNEVNNFKYTKDVNWDDTLEDGYDKGSTNFDKDDLITMSGPNSTYVLPGTIAKILYPHQRDGLRWLWSLHCRGKGGILGDDMGLGKTMQICSFLAGLYHSSLIKRVLIVAPKTLLSHWMKELSMVGLLKNTREYYGGSAVTRKYELQYIFQENGILLTTYDMVRNNSKALQGNRYYLDEEEDDCTLWDYMILDEGHLIKNPNTQRAKSLSEIPSSHRIVISGTPIQNNLKELWTLFNFCCPDLLGDKKWFKEKYESPILQGTDKNASDRDKRIGSSVAKEFRERIQPYMLRRLKNEVFHEDERQNFSKKNEFIVWLKLTRCQRQLYEAFLKSEIVLSAFDGSPLAALTILKKICDHPLILTKRAAEDVLEGMDGMLNSGDMGMAEKLAMHVADISETPDFQAMQDNVSCKIPFILGLLDNLLFKGHRVLIFSQTRKMLNLVEESVISRGFKYLRIDGTTKASERMNIVNEFQEGLGAPIFLLTSQVGGLGLTLTKADRVIVVDPAWNPSTDNQSVDRAYRIGQTKDVIVYRLMTCGTVEEKIYRKQIFKGGLFKAATEHKEQIRYFSQQDLRELFSLPKHGFDVSITQQQLNEEHDWHHTIVDTLKEHTAFLETLNIAGISHHNLLFSKTAPSLPSPEPSKEKQMKEMTISTSWPSSSSSVDLNVNRPEFTFKPKDVKLHSKTVADNNISRKMSAADITARIDRLTRIFLDKETVSRLPDKGEKIKRQIEELNCILDNITEEDKEISHDITCRFEKVSL